MSTPDTDGKKVPPFTSFRLAPAIQKADSCCCEEHCASSAPVSTAVAGTRYTWKISGMDCAACARKVENAVRQIRGVKPGASAVRHRKVSGRCRHRPPRAN